MKKKIAIIAGEPNSINSEIIAKSWKIIQSRYRKNIFIIGNFKLIKSQLKKIKINIPIKKIESIDNFLPGNKMQILNLPIKFTHPFKLKKNQITKNILDSLNLAHKLSKNGDINGFINCPINKKTVFKSQKIGVTEFLGKKNKLNNAEAMLIYNNKYSVMPITTHINLKDVSKTLCKDLIVKKVVTLNKFYKKYLNKKPVVVILGLNPHNAEFRSNSEEKKIIVPAIKKLKKLKYKVLGPYSSDTIFNNRDKYKYDVIVGMYHDQVLTPFKTIFNFDAINITMGLDYVRVSPDHGVANDMIGMKKANPLSLIKCIEFLSRI